MPVRQQYEFTYVDVPTVFVDVVSPLTGISHLTIAQIDTGAEVTVLEETVAEDIGIDLSDAEPILLQGVGGFVDARRALVEIHLLENPELAVTVEVAFAQLGYGAGNLIGLDVFSHIDVSLSHVNRLSYFGIPERA